MPLYPPAGSAAVPDPLILSQYLSVGTPPSESGAIRLTNNVLPVRAQGTITLAVHPTVGKTIIIGAKTYTWAVAIVGEGDIEVGADVTESQFNFVREINIGWSGPPNADLTAADAFVGDDCVLTALLLGTAGNTIVLGGTFSDDAGNSFDAAFMGATRAGVDEGLTGFVTSRNAADDSDVSLIGAIDSPPMGSADGIRIGGETNSPVSEIQFLLDNVVRMSLNNAFFPGLLVTKAATGLTFIDGEYEDVLAAANGDLTFIQLLVDGITTGLLVQPQFATVDSPSQNNEIARVIASYHDGSLRVVYTTIDVHTDAAEPHSSYAINVGSGGNSEKLCVYRLFSDGTFIADTLGGNGSVASLGSETKPWENVFADLPTSDPAVTNEVWLDRGTLKVSGAGIASPGIADTIQLVNQNASIGSANFANAGTAGLYRVSLYLVCSTADITAGNIVATITYNDGVAARTLTSVGVLLTATNKTTKFTNTDIDGTLIMLGSGSIAWSTTLSGIAGTSKYALNLVLERLA